MCASVCVSKQNLTQVTTLRVGRLGGRARERINEGVSEVSLPISNKLAYVRKKRLLYGEPALSTLTKNNPASRHARGILLCAGVGAGIVRLMSNNASVLSGGTPPLPAGMVEMYVEVCVSR